MNSNVSKRVMVILHALLQMYKYEDNKTELKMYIHLNVPTLLGLTTLKQTRPVCSPYTNLLFLPNIEACFDMVVNT